jgi:hypothetical protein
MIRPKLYGDIVSSKTLYGKPQRENSHKENIALLKTLYEKSKGKTHTKKRVQYDVCTSY